MNSENKTHAPDSTTSPEQDGPGVVGLGGLSNAAAAWTNVACRVMQILNQRSLKILLHVDAKTKEFGVKVVW